MLSIGEVSFIILAGGASTRMGRNKADLFLHGQTFLEILKDKAMRLGFGEIIISGYHGFDCKVNPVFDEFAGRGPLSGIHACLKASAREHAMIVSVDTPLIHPELLRQLLVSYSSAGSPITILSHAGIWEPLMGIYPCDLWREIEELLLHNRNCLKHFLKDKGCKTWEAREHLDSLWNINTPQDYQHVKGG